MPAEIPGSTGARQRLLQRLRRVRDVLGLKAGLQLDRPQAGLVETDPAQIDDLKDRPVNGTSATVFRLMSDS